MAIFISLLLILAPITFTFGVILPLVRFESFYFFSETPSLVGIITELFDGGDYLLAILVAAFSIVFPFIKQFAVFLEVVETSRTGQGWVSKFVPILSKWSMMDVLLVALVIVAAKTSGMATAFSQPGLWFYAASAMITIFTHYLVIRQKKLIR